MNTTLCSECVLSTLLSIAPQRGERLPDFLCVCMFTFVTEKMQAIAKDTN
jgi:hypothetical protein